MGQARDIVRTGGKTGTIKCTPDRLKSLLRRPTILKYDPMDFLTGWSNGAVAVWPNGKAPGAPMPTRPWMSHDRNSDGTPESRRL